MRNSNDHTSLTHTHSKCIALSTQARPEPAESAALKPLCPTRERFNDSDTTHSTACLGHTHKPLTRPPRAGSWVSVRYLELNRPTLVRSSASLPSPAATRRASPSSACARPSGGAHRLMGCGERMANARAAQAPAAQATEPAYLLEANCFAASAGTNFLR